jgi:hypothetical protein
MLSFKEEKLDFIRKMKMPIEPIDEDAIWTANIQASHQKLKEMVGIKDEVEIEETKIDLANANDRSPTTNDKLNDSNLLSLSISQILSEERPTPISLGLNAMNNTVFEYQTQDISPLFRPRPAIIDENSPPKKP